VTEEVLSFTFNRPIQERLDHFLVDCLPTYSRARIQRLIRTGLVAVNGTAPKKSGQLLEPSSRIEVRILPNSPTKWIAEDIPLDVVFENEDLIVINKPAGMVVHPAAGHASGTLVHALLGYDPDLEGVGGEERPGVVHRLDKETSGLIILAKIDRAHQWLQDQFRLRKVDKTYLALVDGQPPTPTGRVEAAIGRDPSHRKRMAIVSAAKGREAVSEYKTLESFPLHTLLEIHPLTGRTHQIRLHCTFLGCPVVGDRTYGRKTPSIAINRQFLHAAKLSITLSPGTKRRVFEAALPEELERILESLRKEL
jgi:23S rRNA pseudouridine1911/1915/1917 synthase